MYFESANLMKKGMLRHWKRVIYIRAAMIFIIKHFFNKCTFV